jgi:segregation and condensation protein A
MKFELSTSEFTGPIEALLVLIEKRKLPINDISLAGVTDEYLRSVSTITGDESIAHRIHFVYVASTLALIKSKSLLPQLDLTNDEEADIDVLKRRLVLYQHYQEISVDVKKQFSPIKQFVFPKERKKEIRFNPHDGITLSSLSESLFSVLKEVPEPIETKKEAHIKIAVHIEEIMDSIVERISSSSAAITFNDFLSEGYKEHQLPKEQKVYAVVSFLALLEVVRNHGIGVQQDEVFSDITVLAH